MMADGMQQVVLQHQFTSAEPFFFTPGVYHSEDRKYASNRLSSCLPVFLLWV